MLNITTKKHRFIVFAWFCDLSCSWEQSKLCYGFDPWFTLKWPKHVLKPKGQKCQNAKNVCMWWLNWENWGLWDPTLESLLNVSESVVSFLIDFEKGSLILIWVKLIA